MRAHSFIPWPLDLTQVQVNRKKPNGLLISWTGAATTTLHTDVGSGCRVQLTGIRHRWRTHNPRSGHPAMDASEPVLTFKERKK